MQRDSPGRRIGGLWRERNFALVWTGETTSQLGSAVTTVVMPLIAVRTLHSSALWVSLLTAGAWLPWLLVGLPAGAWVDRLPAKRLLIACDLASMVFFVSVPIAGWYGVLTIWQLLAVSFLGGTSAVLFRTAYVVYLPAVVQRGQLTEANAKLTGSRAAVQIGGPGLGGLIAQLAGAATGLLADAASFGVSLLCLAAVPVGRTAAPRADSQSIVGDIREGLRFLIRDPLLAALTTFAAAANFGLTGLEAVIVLFLARTIHLSSVLVGVTVALLGVGGVVGSALAPLLGRRFGTARAGLVSIVFGLPFALLIPLTSAGPGLTFLLVGVFLASAAVGISNVLTNSFEQTYIPAHMLGRVASASRAAGYSVMPLGAAAAGLVAANVGIRAALWVVSGCIAGSAAILLPSPVRRIRDFPAAPGQPEPARTGLVTD